MRVTSNVLFQFFFNESVRLKLQLRLLSYEGVQSINGVASLFSSYLFKPLLSFISFGNYKQGNLGSANIDFQLNSLFSA